MEHKWLVYQSSDETRMFFRCPMWLSNNIELFGVYAPSYLDVSLKTNRGVAPVVRPSTG
jgi:hypothetical protein